MIKDIEKLADLNLIKYNKIQYGLSLLEQEATALVKERSRLSAKVKSSFKSVYAQDLAQETSWVQGLKETLKNLDRWRNVKAIQIDKLTQRLNEIDRQKDGLKAELKANIVQDNILAALQAKARQTDVERQIDAENERVLSLKTISNLGVRHA